jgi:hypothetical protein
MRVGVPDPLGVRAEGEMPVYLVVDLLSVVFLAAVQLKDVAHGAVGVTHHLLHLLPDVLVLYLASLFLLVEEDGARGLFGRSVLVMFQKLVNFSV